MLRAQIVKRVLLSAGVLAQLSSGMSRSSLHFAGLVLSLIIISSSTDVHAKTPPKPTAWFGLDRGPLAPAKADKLETELVTALGSQKSIQLVDVAGGALSERSLAHHASGLAKLIDQGIELLLSLKATQSIEKLDLAIKLFEARLTSLRDHELLHDAMLAKAEAEMILKRRETAKNTLKKLAALKPKQAPTRNTHERKFVKLWESALSDLGHQGTIEVQTSPRNAYVQIDGRPIGKAPVTSKPLHAGRHYIVARWPSTVVSKMVQLSPGQNLFVELKPTGPSHRVKKDLQSQSLKRIAPTRLQTSLRKICKIAGTKQILLGQVLRGDKGNYVVISRYDEQGTLIFRAAAKIGLEAALMKAVSADKAKGVFEVKADGKTGPMPKLSEAAKSTPPPTQLAEVSTSTDTALPAGVLLSPSNTSTATTLALSNPPPPATSTETDAEESSWLLWTLVGLAVAGAGAGGALLLVPSASQTQITVNLP